MNLITSQKMTMDAPPVKSPLARYRLLSPSASLRVSPLCLGAMNFGDAWKGHMGSCDQKTSESILDYYYEQGGNFIDTANVYQSEESEKCVLLKELSCVILLTAEDGLASG